MDKVKSKMSFQNLSLRRALVVSTVVAVAIGVTAVMIVGGLSGELRNSLMEPYLQEYALAPGVSTKIVVEQPTGWVGFYTSNERFITLILMAFIIGGTILAESFLFYRWKLKRPLRVLNEASEKIAANDLNFTIGDYGDDELGRLCQSFETMRAALEENYRVMWRSVEERKRVNAAFSHDLRTPLTVLRGYTDLATAYVPLGKFSEEKLMCTMASMSLQIKRLERYTESMGSLQHLEDMPCRREDTDFDHLMEGLRESAQIVCDAMGRNLHFDCGGTEEKCSAVLSVDRELIAQVFENMIANAARFAKREIRVDCRVSSDGRALMVDVTDDGQGFSQEGLIRAADPFYRGVEQENDSAMGSNSGHFGLGLHICTILCEKHGGSMVIGNTSTSGARVTAKFNLQKQFQDLTGKVDK